MSPNTMPTRVDPRPAPTAEALFDRNSGKLWLEFPDSRVIPLGTAAHNGRATGMLKSIGLLPTEGWTTAFGTLRSCLVSVPEGWSPPS